MTPSTTGTALELGGHNRGTKGLIQTLGRWRSDTFKLYIKIPQVQLASMSKTLVRSH